MYKRSIKLMFITQTNDFGSVIWKIEQHICQSKNVTNFTPPLPTKYSMLKHFDVIQKLVPSKDHFNNKKHYTSKTYVPETGCHGNMINHMDMVIISKQCFRDIHLPEENFHRSLHEMGFLHSTKV